MTHCIRNCFLFVLALLACLANTSKLHAGGDPEMKVILQPGERKTFPILYPAFKDAFVEFRGTGATDVDMFVRTRTGMLVGSETSIFDRGGVTWRPPVQQVYLVEFWNLGDRRNTITIRHNGDVKAGGAVAPVDPGVPALNVTRNFKVPPKGKSSFSMVLLAGKNVRVQMIGSNRTDVDLFILDAFGKQIASDEARSSRADLLFRVPTSTNYRIEVRNLGDVPNDVNITVNYDR